MTEVVVVSGPQLGGIGQGLIACGDERRGHAVMGLGADHLVASTPGTGDRFGKPRRSFSAHRKVMTSRSRIASSEVACTRSIDEFCTSSTSVSQASATHIAAVGCSGKACLGVRPYSRTWSTAGRLRNRRLYSRQVRVADGQAVRPQAVVDEEAGVHLPRRSIASFASASRRTASRRAMTWVCSVTRRPAGPFSNSPCSPRGLASSGREVA